MTKAALFALVLLFAAPGWAATKWVDITGGGTGSANGSSVSNLCTGTADADCAVSAGDTQVWCGSSASLASITLPTAGTSNTFITYDGSCPGGVAANWTSSGGASNAGILQNKDWTIVQNMVVANPGGRVVQTNCSNCKLISNTLYGGQDNVFITTPQSKSNIYLGYNSIYGASRYGLTANTNSASTNSITDVTLEHNDISRNANTNVFVQCGIAAADCNFKRWLVQHNTFNDSATNVGFVMQDCYVVAAVDCGTVQTNSGADFEDMAFLDNEASGNAVGGFALYGLKSSTGAWGKNQYARNTTNRNGGVIGGVDLFNSLYVELYDNESCDNTTESIDGNGVLVDYGNRYIKVYRNHLCRNPGKAGVENSGVAVMCLKCKDVQIFSNFGDGNKAGLYFSGGTFSESDVAASNNTFTNSADFGAYFDSTQDGGSTTLKNNALSGDGVGIYVETSGGVNTEDYNALVFPTRANYNGVGWSDGANSITSDLELGGGSAPTYAAAFIPKPSSPLRRAGVCVLSAGCVNSDCLGRRRYVPPDIGACQGN